jgi:hypothetical protein
VLLLLLLVLCLPLYTAPVPHPYRRYYALLAERFAKLKREYADAFSEAFVAQYQLIHRLETNKLRNTAKLFAHLLSTDAIPWAVLQVRGLLLEGLGGGGGETVCVGCFCVGCFCGVLRRCVVVVWCRVLRDRRQEDWVAERRGIALLLLSSAARLLTPVPLCCFPSLLPCR